MPRSYQIWSVGLIVLQLVAGAVLWAAMGLPTASSNLMQLLIAALITVFSSCAVLRANEVSSWSVEKVIAMALVCAGKPVEALVCITLANLVMPLRKPLVGHLILSNLAAGAFLVAAAAAALEAFAPDARLFSGEWLVASLLVVSVLQIIVETLTIDVPLVLGKYETVREVLRTWFREGLSHLASMTPVVILLAGSQRIGDEWWYSLFLATPLLVLFDLLDRTEQLVEAKSEARLDPLTGLLNRRAFDEALFETAGYGLDDRPDLRQARTWVLMCDLDNFKQLNDTQGHDAGDRALIAAAGVLRRSVREHDMCGRYGGEEFIILVKDATRDVAKQIAERIRSGVQASLTEYGMTVSVGAHGLAANDTALSAVIAADKAMYFSKQNGKNRVTFSDRARLSVVEPKAA